MKWWKIAVLVPYILIFGWLAYLWLLLPKAKTLGEILVDAVFMGFGLYAVMAYTVILVIALLIRWLILRRR